MKKITALLLVFLMLLGVLVGCSEAGKNNETTVTTLSKQPSADSGKREGKPLKIVTTIFPEYDWVREILGSKADMAELTMLLDNGVDLHSYQPTAEDLVKISDCDLFVYVGGESDGWVENALKNAANKDRKVINLLDVLKDRVKTEEAVPGMQAEKGHSHGVADFADSDVQDRSLSDWDGQWQSVYPYVLDGTLDPVMEMKAESGKMTAEEYKNFYRSAYETDVEKSPSTAIRSHIPARTAPLPAYMTVRDSISGIRTMEASRCATNTKRYPAMPVRRLTLFSATTILPPQSRSIFTCTSAMPVLTALWKKESVSPPSIRLT